MKILACLVALFLLFTLVACASPEEPAISLLEKPAENTSDVGENPLLLTPYGQTVHKDETCPHLRNTEPETLRQMKNDNETVTTLLSIGYTLCETCFAVETNGNK